MSELLLDSLEIKGYRCFEHLKIEELGRVNLIVGKNNVGKTALLEALWIWANNQTSSKYINGLSDVFENRDESSKAEPSSHEVGMLIRNIVFNRPDFERKKVDTEIKIGSKKYVSIELTSYGNFEPPCMKKNISFEPTHFPFPVEFIRSSGLTNDKLLYFWDFIERNVQEDKVVEAMNIITNDVVDVRFSRHTFTNASADSIPIVRLKNAKERIPLRSLGEGMARLLGIGITLVNCQNGMLLLDEIESGLHYSVLPKVWKLIFKSAKELNVQVFATTHSKDCVEAFAETANDSPEDGMLIRIERHGEKIVAKTIEEEMLVDAVNYEVEVR
jgi:AAA15 family ATPase/GTPase